jgi:hypothetical protein
MKVEGWQCKRKSHHLLRISHLYQKSGFTIIVERYIEAEGTVLGAVVIVLLFGRNAEK